MAPTIRNAKLITFTIMFETEEYETKDEAVFAVLYAIQNYEQDIDPRRIRWVDDDLISTDD